MRNPSRSLAFPGALALLAALSCGGGGGGPDTLDERFRTGPETARTIAADVPTEVQDPATGRTFLFPKGGHGTLTTAAVAEGPARPYPGGELFLADFDGPEPVQLRLPDTADAADYLMGYGRFTGDGNEDGEWRWVHLPSAGKADGALAFELAFPFDGGDDTTTEGALDGRVTSALRVTGKRWLGFRYYWVGAISTTGTAAENRALMVAEAEGFMSRWLNEMEPAMRDAAVAETAERLKPRYFFDGNYYIGFTRRLLGNSTTPMLGLNVAGLGEGLRADVIAHEVGHYLSHVLNGDAAYLRIEDRAPDAKHGLGTRLGRGTVTEEYAYFSQYFLLGSVNAGDPTEPYAFFGASRGPSPRSVDYPGLEGFGCVLLASLVRSQPEVASVVSRQREKVPVIGLHFREVFGILSAGAADVAALRDAVEAALTARGLADRLPALAERIGWSHFATGRLVGPDGKGLGGARIEAIAKAGTTEYVMPASDAATTLPSGAFTLARLFPGKSTLRVTSGGKTVDVPLDVGWSAPTDVALALEPIAVDLGAGPVECAVQPTCSLAFTYRAVSETGYEIPGDTVTTGDVPGVPEGGTWEGTGKAGSGVHLRLELDAACGAVRRFEASGSTATSQFTMTGGGVPRKAGAGTGQAWELRGAAACAAVSAFSKADANPMFSVATWSCTDGSGLRIECR